MTTIYHRQKNRHDKTPPRPGGNGAGLSDPRPPRNMAAVVKVLSEKLRYNVSADQIEIADAGGSWRRVEESDLRRITERVQLSGMPDATIATVSDAVARRADAQRYDPLREFFEGLPAWDGTERVKDVLGPKYLGSYLPAESDPRDREVFRGYYAAIGGRWLFDCVARALDPGCEISCVPILVGLQPEIMVALQALVPPGWLHQLDALPPDLGTMDGARRLVGKWIVILPPFRHDNRALVKRKAFLSQTRDRTGRRGILGDDRPRQCGFVGVRTHHDLADDDGVRLLYPVFVDSRPDLQAIRADQAQIWAEALWLRQNPDCLTKVRLGGEYDLPCHVATEFLIRETGSDFLDTESDAIALHCIEEWLAARPDRSVPFTLSQLIGGVSRFQFAERKSVEMQIARLLRSQGYDNRRCWRGRDRGQNVWGRIRFTHP